MLRVNSMNADAYGPVRVIAALDLLVLLTDDIFSVMRNMSPEMCREVWQGNPTTRDLSRKFDRLQLNLDRLNLQR